MIILKTVVGLILLLAGILVTSLIFIGVGYLTIKVFDRKDIDRYPLRDHFGYYYLTGAALICVCYCSIMLGHIIGTDIIEYIFS